MRPADPAITVRGAQPLDAGPVSDIYNHYVKDTIVTFEEEPVSAPEMSLRMEQVRKARLPWLVADRGGTVVGYTCARPWNPRRGYRFSTEVTVYVTPERGRQGIGSLMYAALLAALRERGMHAALGGIALPNDASVALHESFGFRKMAHLEQVGFKFNRWIDVGYWQRIL